MEKSNKGGEPFRRPPTSPKGHLRKKARWQAPPRPFDSKSDEDGAPEPKPLFLGGYAVQQAPSAATEFKIRGRGRSPAAPKSEPAWEEDTSEAPSFRRHESAFFSAADSIFAQVQTIKTVVTQSGYALSHPIARAAENINAQLCRLSGVCRAMCGEIQSMAADMEQLSAHGEGL
jgi:hypothetical protein